MGFVMIALFSTLLSVCVWNSAGTQVFANNKVYEVVQIRMSKSMYRNALRLGQKTYDIADICLPQNP